MSCCKSTNTEFTSENKTSGNYIGRIIYFVSGVVGFTILLPFLWIGLVYLIFNSTILNRPSNILPSMAFISNLLTRKDKIDSDEEEDEELDEGDYELLNYEEIRE